MSIIKYVVFRKSDRIDKRLKAVFLDEDKKEIITTHFGLKNGRTYIDHNDEDKREAYIARHKVREDFDNYITAGSLARYIFWEKKTLKGAIDNYRKKFNLK